MQAEATEVSSSDDEYNGMNFLKQLNETLPTMVNESSISLSNNLSQWAAKLEIESLTMKNTMVERVKSGAEMIRNEIQSLDTTTKVHLEAFDHKLHLINANLSKHQHDSEGFLIHNIKTISKDLETISSALLSFPIVRQAVDTASANLSALASSIDYLIKKSDDTNLLVQQLIGSVAELNGNQRALQLSLGVLEGRVSLAAAPVRPEPPPDPKPEPEPEAERAPTVGTDTGTAPGKAAGPAMETAPEPTSAVGEPIVKPSLPSILNVSPESTMSTNPPAVPDSANETQSLEKSAESTALPLVAQSPRPIKRKTIWIATPEKRVTRSMTKSTPEVPSTSTGPIQQAESSKEMMKPTETPVSDQPSVSNQNTVSTQAAESNQNTVTQAAVSPQAAIPTQNPESARTAEFVHTSNQNTVTQTASSSPKPSGSEVANKILESGRNDMLYVQFISEEACWIPAVVLRKIVPNLWSSYAKETTYKWQPASLQLPGNHIISRTQTPVGYSYYVSMAGELPSWIWEGNIEKYLPNMLRRYLAANG